MENEFPEWAIGSKLQTLAPKTMFEHDPEFIINAFPRCGNTFLHVAVRLSWPDLVIQSHVHDPSLYAKADGSIPFVSIARNPEDVMASWAVHLSSVQENIELNQELGAYIEHLQAAKANPNVLVLPFNELTLNTNDVLDKIAKRFNMPSRIAVSNDQILEATKELSQKATVDEQKFIKQGHTPRDKDPLYDTVLSEIRQDRYATSMKELTNIYNELVKAYETI